jgi:hypothetical protein
MAWWAALQCAVSLVFGTVLTAFTSWTSDSNSEAILLKAINFYIAECADPPFRHVVQVVSDTPVAWPDVWSGALVMALFLNIGKAAISRYIGTPFEQTAPTGVLTVCTMELPMNILCKTLLIAAGAAIVKSGP